MNKKIIWGIIAVLVILVVFLVYKDVNRKVCWPYCPGMTDQDREVIKQQMIDAQNSSATTSASDWKTYVRQNMYTFTYPKYADIKENNNVVTDTAVVLTSDLMNSFEVTTYPEPKPVFCANNPYKNMAGIKGISYTEDKVNKDGNEYRHLHETDSSQGTQTITEDRYYILRNNVCYMIIAKTSNTANTSVVNDVSKIFSSFKFTK